MTKRMKDFTYNGITINFNDDELTNLTRMWKLLRVMLTRNLRSG